MFGNSKIADKIAKCCFDIDKRCRGELHRGYIVSERDYVSALSTRIRDEVRTQFGISCHSQTVSPRLEKKYGVDGIIVFKCGNEVKVGLFEAKRPQIYNAHKPAIINNYQWDQLTAGGMTSHFSKQIQKQRKWLGVLALWEMFFNDGPIGFASPPFDSDGSSCVWHDSAYSFMNTNGSMFRPWATTPDLQNLLKVDCVNFHSIIRGLLICNAGIKHRIDTQNQTAKILSRNSEHIMDIPLPLETISKSNENDERVEEFLTDNNLHNFTFLDLDNIKLNTIL